MIIDTIIETLEEIADGAQTALERCIATAQDIAPLVEGRDRPPAPCCRDCYFVPLCALAPNAQKACKWGVILSEKLDSIDQGIPQVVPVIGECT